MTERLKQLWAKYYEQLTYLIFGGLATLLNIVLAMVFRSFGMPTTLNTVLDNVICILFAYTTNRLWVFKSRSRGADALREFGSFIACRLGTMVMDVAVMWLGADVIGPALLPAAWLGLWFLGVKVFSNVLVIVFNYVFSKKIIFIKKK
ncbi:membrane protein [Oscillospiraceae bacterium]|uniref:GtrA family protein n=1 Tax=Allofournierella sp. TaxID=1940256 RepID=UPI00207E2D47|nr:membrane protein [Oscillospiraceae bacterium]